jgi:hypothetical protein
MHDDWRVLTIYPDPISAEGLAGLLRSERIDVRILADEPVPGLMKSYSVLVRAPTLARAQAVSTQAAMSDEEWAQYAADVLASGPADPDRDTP